MWYLCRTDQRFLSHESSTNSQDKTPTNVQNVFISKFCSSLLSLSQLFFCPTNFTLGQFFLLSKQVLLAWILGATVKRSYDLRQGMREHDISYTSLVLGKDTSKSYSNFYRQFKLFVVKISVELMCIRIILYSIWTHL